MAHTPIQTELRADGALLHITLNTPKANILDKAMVGAIADTLAEHGSSRDLRTIAFEGAGSHFSFGASVEEHQAEHVAAMLSQFHALFRQLAELSVPTMAIVHGQCLGGGLELASYCSWIFADNSARFGQPEIKLAVFAPMASILLPWRCGGTAALDLCVSGRSISAADAYRIGLVSSVSNDPAATAQRFFEENLAQLSASSLRFAEKAARRSLLRALKEDLPTIERLYLDELMKTADANEGIAAFLDRRKK